MTTVLFIASGYAFVLMVTLAVVTVAKRADEDVDRHVQAIEERSAPDAGLDRVPAEIGYELGAERVEMPPSRRGAWRPSEAGSALELRASTHLRAGQDRGRRHGRR